MTVNSLFFLLFLSGLFLVHYLLCPVRFRWIVLLAASMLFYALASAASPVYMLATSVCTWAAGLVMERLNEQEKQAGKDKEQKSKIKTRKRWLLAVSAVPSFGFLLLLKYSGFFANMGNSILGRFGIALPVPQFLIPLGISYYTLIAYGYLLDLYEKRVQAQRNYTKLLLFLAYFPQMTQGPMNRYKPMSEQLYEGHRFEYQDFSYGC